MRKTALALMLGLGVASAVPTVSAADFSKNTYGAVLFNYVVPEDDRDAKYGLGGSVVFLGKPLAEHLNLELSGFGNTLKRSSDGGNDTQFGLGVDLMFPLVKGAVRPFILVGAGGIREQLDTSNDTDSINPYVNAGGGLLFELGSRFSARAEARWLVDFNNGSYPSNDQLGDARFGLGLQYAFGKPYVAPPPPPPPVATPPPPPPPADSDGDGVIDPNDKCPNTPKGVKVDSVGCPIDTDGDGVPDYLDKCPSTPKGFKIDAEGCIVEQKIVLRGVNFEYDKDQLTAEAKSILDGVLPGLIAQPKLTLEIGGHTDSRGADAYNQKLSQRRANSVLKYLTDKGVAAERLKAVGYGEAKPVADNKTEPGRAENRRVEFDVLNKPLSVKVIKK
jgi:OOP family OmpA-OmpF porin